MKKVGRMEKAILTALDLELKGFASAADTAWRLAAKDITTPALQAHIVERRAELRKLASLEV